MVILLTHQTSPTLDTNFTQQSTRDFTTRQTSATLDTNLTQQSSRDFTTHQTSATLDTNLTQQSSRDFTTRRTSPTLDIPRTQQTSATSNTERVQQTSPRSNCILQSVQVRGSGSSCKNFFFLPGNRETCLRIVYNGSSQGNQECFGHVNAPAGKYISVKVSPVEMLGTCKNRLSTFFSLRVNDMFRMYPCIDYRYDVLDPTNKVPSTARPETRSVTYHAPGKKIKYYLWLSRHTPPFRITMRITAADQNRRKTLEVSHVSRTVVPYGFDGSSDYAVDLDAWARLYPPSGHSVMISFPYVDVAYSVKCTDDQIYLEVDWKWAASFCGSYQRPPMVYLGEVGILFQSVVHSRGHSGFISRFSFHGPSEVPDKLRTTALNTAVFNCSVFFYAKFKQHLECNLDTECLQMEDEDRCVYSTGACEPGFLGAGSKCYKYVKLGYKFMTWYDASAVCLKQGLALASFPTTKEEEVFREKILQFAFTTDRSFFGLRTSDPSLPSMYGEVWQWTTGLMAYYVHINKQAKMFKPMCAAFNKLSKHRVSIQVCGDNLGMHYIFCEAERPMMFNKINLPPTDIQTTFGLNNSTRFVACSDHMTHDFLSCDHINRCGADPGVMLCVTLARSDTTERRVEVPMFVCDSQTQTIHYTQICDHHEQCFDSSDENFCIHQICPEKQCRNQQCVKEARWCDGMAHCSDGSDEACSQFLSGSEEPFITSSSDVHVVLLDGHGKYKYAPQSDEFPVCPRTHFMCANRELCLPVYLRCNGVDDCSDVEDENSCNDVTCPGYYQCRGSAVCVHSDHMCDGVFQCPHQDDELLCELVCPENCLCQGLAFICPRHFHVQNYSDIRYLDASKSGLYPDRLFHNHYLVRLILASSGLHNLPSFVFPNMKFLDLSNNTLINISMHVFLKLSNLNYLNLSENPITTLAVAETDTLLRNLQSLDLSHTKVRNFESAEFWNVRNLKRLNLSHSALSVISRGGFNTLGKIELLDLRGTELEVYPLTMLLSLNYLRIIFSDVYKMCCQEVLPHHFNIQNCHASSDEIASCKDLLQSGIYRLFLWVSCCFALIGNAVSFAARIFLEKSKSPNSSSVFIGNLNVADFFMGLYLAVVGSADQVYRGTYLWHDEVWKTSACCRTAGFFSLLSCEMSAFVICFITLDRFLVTRFPFSQLHFRGESAGVVCGLSWLISIALATVPLLPMTSNWEFYSQTGICIPLPITRKKFKGHFYSFGILIVFNFLVFVFIAIGQLFIYTSVRDNSMITAKKHEREARVARRLLVVVMSDFLCWFPIGLLGLLASSGIPIPGEVNVAMAIFALPLNSALNPFVYTFNLLMEKRRKASKERLLKFLQSRISS